MPPNTGVEATFPATLVKGSPNSRIVMIGCNENLAYARATLSAGVLGCVLRKASDAELFLAIGSAYWSHRYIDPRLSDSLADVLLARTSGDTRSSEGRLSKRELQALRGVARGFTSQEMARQLQIRTKTVETYRSRIYDKLNVQTRANLVEYALTRGLLAKEEAPS